MPDELPTNGWRSGRDPVQRWLRVVAVITCLAVFAYLAIDPTRHVDVVPTLALALGAVLLLLGYESLVKIPGVTKDATTIERQVCKQPECDEYATHHGYCDRHRRAVE